MRPNPVLQGSLVDEWGTRLQVKEAEKVVGALRRDQVSLRMKNQGGLLGGGDAGHVSQSMYKGWQACGLSRESWSACGRVWRRPQPGAQGRGGNDC